MSLPTVEERVARWIRPNPDTGCWEWTGSRNHRGYGKFTVKRSTITAHRWVYEQHRGPIPDGLHIDHLCRNRGCVNPEHLEPVTRGENYRRSLPRRHGIRVCPHGHEITGTNRYVRRDNGFVECRTCKNARERARKARTLTNGERR